MLEKITIEWWIDDVLELAKQHGIKLSKAEASDVLSLAEHKHDANIGINWDVLLYHIGEVKRGR